MSTPLAVTMGEPAGIGGEIALLAWLRRGEGVPPFFLVDNRDRLAELTKRLGWSIVLEEITGPEQANSVFARALPVLDIPLPVAVEPGRPDIRNGGAVIAAIDTALDLVGANRAAAVVTNPIHKKTLGAAGFRHPGHTEYLAERAGCGEFVMMLACPGLRVVPVTVHLSLRNAIARLTPEAILAAGRITARCLAEDFGIVSPRLAVAALNPHAGEGGTMGREESDIICPAVAELQRLGIDAAGPAPADTLFHAAARGRYDAALCMYHDQALIPLKTIDFAGGVNVTLGLPFIRTSPDHGTAFDIAGRGIADPASLIAALHMAAEMAEHRARRARATTPGSATGATAS
jgi:4-hydroxythreonine-4-phosphate dehydrogenase